MNSSLDRNPLKSPVYTRKKIENYSYGLNDIIGKGYSSQVYKGKNDENNTPVAVKVIDLKMLKNQINRQLLDSEIEILKELKSKSNILTLHDVYTTKNNTYLITQLCSSDLNKLVKNRMTESQAYFYMAQFLQGYRHIHARQIVHRDLKPANLLLTEQKQLKIADFGFGIKMKELTLPGKYNVGSPLYMAPESLKKNEYSYKSDLWAIGVIFFEMLTGDTPWRAKTQKDLLRKIQNESIDKILRKKQFSKITVEFLSRILCVDKNQRLSPQELYRFDFRGQSLSNVLSERRLNQRLSREDRYTSVNASEFISPKNAFNNSIEKNFFKVNRSQRNIQLNSQHKSYKLDMKRQHHTLKEIKQNQQTKVKNPQNLKCQDKKIISKVLISLIHMCRFLFKLLGRIRESQSVGILKEIGCFQIQAINFAYTRVIRYLVDLLRQFPKYDFLGVENYQTYKKTTDYTKLIKIFNEYNQRYSTQLKSYWEQDSTDNQPVFSSNETSKLIEVMVKYCEQISSSFQDPTQDIQKINKDIIIIDYLMTAKQLLQMLDKGGRNFFVFAKKSRIQDIVQGNTADITYQLFQKIVQKSRSLLKQQAKSNQPVDNSLLFQKNEFNRIKKCIKSPQNRSQRCLLAGHNRSGKTLVF